MITLYITVNIPILLSTDLKSGVKEELNDIMEVIEEVQKEHPDAIFERIEVKMV